MAQVQPCAAPPPRQAWDASEQRVVPIAASRGFEDDDLSVRSVGGCSGDQEVPVVPAAAPAKPEGQASTPVEEPVCLQPDTRGAVAVTCRCLPESSANVVYSTVACAAVAFCMIAVHSWLISHLSGLEGSMYPSTVCETWSSSASTASDDGMHGRTYSLGDLGAVTLLVDTLMFATLGGAEVVWHSLLHNAKPWQVAGASFMQFVFWVFGTGYVAAKGGAIYRGKSQPYGFVALFGAFMLTSGIMAIAVSLTWDKERQSRYIVSRCGTVFWAISTLLVYLGLQSCFFVAEAVLRSGISPMAYVALLVLQTHMSEFVLKVLYTFYPRVPVSFCAYAIFAFQIGMFYLMRVVMQELDSLAEVLLSSVAVGVAEVIARTGNAMLTRFFRNRVLSRGGHELASRYLSVFATHQVTGMLAEHLAIAMSASFFLFGDQNTFHYPQRMDAWGTFASMLIQSTTECCSDVAALMLAQTLLPLSFREFYQSRGAWRLHAAIVLISITFYAGELNFRIKDRNFRCD